MLLFDTKKDTSKCLLVLFSKFINPYRQQQLVE